MTRESKLYLIRDRKDYIKKLTNDNVVEDKYLTEIKNILKKKYGKSLIWWKIYKLL